MSETADPRTDYAVDRGQQPQCDQCDTHEDDPDHLGRPIELNRWPNLDPPVQMCPSCTHDAYRSGWEPGR